MKNSTGPHFIVECINKPSETTLQWNVVAYNFFLHFTISCAYRLKNAPAVLKHKQTPGKANFIPQLFQTAYNQAV